MGSLRESLNFDVLQLCMYNCEFGVRFAHFAVRCSETQLLGSAPRALDAEALGAGDAHVAELAHVVAVGVLGLQNLKSTDSVFLPKHLEIHCKST